MKCHHYEEKPRMGSGPEKAIEKGMSCGERIFPAESGVQAGERIWGAQDSLSSFFFISRILVSISSEYGV
jgi:hypothetical protein